ncbi:MAG: hypothetical protein IIZ39_04325, partial [Blautia sp.]|nr:hypothetical protein [Blautia sp.]
MLEKVVNLVSTIVNTVTRDKRQVVAPPGADTAARDVTDAAKPNGSVDNETAVTLSSEGPLILGDTASGSLKPDAMGAVDNPLGGVGHRLDESEPVADIPTDTDAGLPSPGKETACAGETQPREPVTRSREESARQYDQYVRDNQISFFGLTTENTVGIPLDGENRWIKLYNQIPWEKFIPKYEEARKTQKEERTPAYKTRELAELLKDQQPEVAAIGEQL